MENRQELLDSLVDIRDVKIDRSLPVEERMKSYVEQIKNPYMFKVGNTRCPRKLCKYYTDHQRQFPESFNESVNGQVPKCA